MLQVIYMLCYVVHTFPHELLSLLHVPFWLTGPHLNKSREFVSCQQNTCCLFVKWVFFFSFFRFADDELEDFIAQVLKASAQGISALRNATSEPNWTFGQALFFSTTVVTTIGIANFAHFLFVRLFVFFFGNHVLWIVTRFYWYRLWTRYTAQSDR